MKKFLCIIFLGLVLDANAQDIKRVKIADLEKTIAEASTPLVVNFWATYCAPCIEEIPYFQEEVARLKQSKVQLLLVSIDGADDYPGKIAATAKRFGFTAPIIFLDESDANYFCPRIDPKWSGAVPATLFINNTTKYRHFNPDEMTREEFKKEVSAMLQKQ